MEEAIIREFPKLQNYPIDPITEILREGAKKLLAQALQAEVDAHLAQFSFPSDSTGKQLVRRNGYLPERKIQTGVGEVLVKQPRVRDDRDEAVRVKFSSKILPAYLRKTKSLEELIPWLYLKGVSTGDFSEALSALVGVRAAGLSPATISRLKEGWTSEYQEWANRSLAGTHYVYMWADAVYFSVRGSDEKPCVMVLIGAKESGEKEVIAIEEGMRESALSWCRLLEDLKKRGLEKAPRIAVGDGALGFWKALSQVFPSTREQRCWVHKTANILNCLPKSLHGKAKEDIHEIWMADTRANAEKSFDAFIRTYGAKHPKAVECLRKDKNELLAFYDFPAEHWVHLRTTNPIESTFATVRHRTRRTKNCGSAQTTLAMVFKLMQSAQKKWRRLNGRELLADVIQLIEFVDGIRKAA